MGLFKAAVVVGTQGEEEAVVGAAVAVADMARLAVFCRNLHNHNYPQSDRHKKK